MILALLACVGFEPSVDAASVRAPTSTVSVPTVPTPLVTWDGMTRDELVHVDVRGTYHSARIVLSDLEQLSPERRAEAAEALRVLQVTCPFNRASVQLPVALLAVVSQTHPDALDPMIQTDWELLRKGLEAHVAALDVLGAELPLPVEGDYLHGRIYPDAPKTRAQLAQVDDPVAATRPLLASIQFVVDDYDDATKATIDANHAVLAAATDDRWPMKDHLVAWRTVLKKMQPFLEDEALETQVSGLILALDEYIGQQC